MIQIFNLESFMCIFWLWFI